MVETGRSKILFYACFLKNRPKTVERLTTLLSRRYFLYYLGFNVKEELVEFGA